eukprot:1831820-Alexandrium_andersonii.AAC.2
MAWLAARSAIAKHRHPAGLDRVDARSGQDNSYSPAGTGAGVHVYVADTGIRTTHRRRFGVGGGRSRPSLVLVGGPWRPTTSNSLPTFSCCAPLHAPCSRPLSRLLACWSN